MMVDDIFEEADGGNQEAFQNVSFGKEIDLRTNDDGGTPGGSDSLIEHYKKMRKVQRDVMRNASNCSILPDHKGTNNQSGTTRSDAEIALTGAMIRTKVQPHASASEVLNMKSSNSAGGSSELGELARIFGSFPDEFQEHISRLSEIVGRETISEKIAVEKRARLNGELVKLPNLKQYC